MGQLYFSQLKSELNHRVTEGKTFCKNVPQKDFSEPHGEHNKILCSDEIKQCMFCPWQKTSIYNTMKKGKLKVLTP